MGLRETLEAATPGPWTWNIEEWDDGGYLASRSVIESCGTTEWMKRVVTAHGMHTEGFVVVDNSADAALIALAPELASLALDMGEQLEVENEKHPNHNITKLLARLDQLGKEQT